MSRVGTKELLTKKKRKEQENSAIVENCYQLCLPSSLFLGSRNVRMQSPGFPGREGSRILVISTSSVDLVLGCMGLCFVIFLTVRMDSCHP